MLLLVCGDIESNPGPGSNKNVRVLYSNRCYLHANLDKLAVAGSDFDRILSLKSLIADPTSVTEPNTWFGFLQQRLMSSTSGAQDIPLYVRGGFHSFSQSKLECSCRKSWVYRICIRINNFYVYAFYRNPGHDGSFYDCLLESRARVQSVDDKTVFVFVCDANAHHTEWLESVSPTDRHRRAALNFCNLSGCEQLVRCTNHITGSRIDFVMTDAPDIVDMFLGTPMGTSVHCFFSCVFHIQQSVPE